MARTKLTKRLVAMKKRGVTLETTLFDHPGYIPPQYKKSQPNLGGIKLPDAVRRAGAFRFLIQHFTRRPNGRLRLVYYRRQRLN
jgi:hypothetical protein